MTRQEAIKHLEEWKECISSAYRRQVIDMAIEALVDRPTGEWIDADGKKVRLDADGHPLDSCWCSNCGEWLVASDEHEVLGKFCPNCGTRMYKGGESDG